MSLAVRSDMSEANLRNLLGEGHESETLDYKGSCDLSKNDEELEIVKDIAAMQIEGGYIVIGADDHGQPTGQVEKRHIKLFEQASLRSKVRKYLSEPLDVRARHHHIDGHDYILVYIAENTDGFAVVNAPGNNSKNECIFRQGDVFARHGTASERWNQHDIAKIKAKLVERERERWLREATQTFFAHLPSSEVSAIAAGPARALTWQLDNDTFLEVVIEQIRRQDLIPIKLLLSGIHSDVGTMVTQDSAEERVAVVIDRLTCLAALLLQLDEETLFHAVIGAFVAIYNLPIGANGIPRSDVTMRAEVLWFQIIQRIIGVGALAERLEKWDAIRDVVLQTGRGFQFERYFNWYRHALTMAARADLLVIETSGRRSGSSLLHFAQAHVEQLDCLRPDLPPDDEDILNSLCRFDMLACLVGIDDAGTPDGGAYYPNFARYRSERSTPAVTALLENSEMRRAIFRGNDEQLAAALRAIDSIAIGEARLTFGWSGFGDERIRQFIESHLVSS